MRRRYALSVLAAAALVCGSLGPPALAQQEQPPNGAISGQVTDENGVPLEGVCVSVDDLFGIPFFGMGWRAVTDAAGRYTVSDVPAGSHFVSFNACADHLDGYALEFYDDTTDWAQIDTVEVQAGATTAGIDAALGDAAVVTGALTDVESGAALVGDCVVAVGATGGLFVFVRTRDDGTYRVANLPGGDYRLQFGDCSDPYTHVTEAFDDVTAEEMVAGTQPDTVSVAVGDEVTVDAQLLEGGAITGTLTALHTGEPMRLACIEARAPGVAETEPTVYGTLSGIAPDLSSLPAGRYVVGGMPAGDYDLRFSDTTCQPEGYAQEWYDDAGTRADATTLTVTRGAVLEGIDAVLRPVPSIEYACFGGEPAHRFRDVSDGNVHQRAIDCLAAIGIVSGTGSDTYSPAAPVRRDQMASFLARTLASLGVALPQEPPDRFRDDDGNVHEQAIEQLAALGIVSGVSQDEYAPARSVTRAQMARFLAATYEHATGFTLRADRDHFTDDDGSIHEDRIDHVATAAIATGTSPTTYSPSQVVRRDQMASFLARTFDRVSRDTNAGLFPVATTSSGGASATYLGTSSRWTTDP